MPYLYATCRSSMRYVVPLMRYVVPLCDMPYNNTVFFETSRVKGTPYTSRTVLLCMPEVLLRSHALSDDGWIDVEMKGGQGVFLLDGLQCQSLILLRRTSVCHSTK
jgi:hypothetical protein